MTIIETLIIAIVGIIRIILLTQVCIINRGNTFYGSIINGINLQKKNNEILKNLKIDGINFESDKEGDF